MKAYFIILCILWIFIEIVSAGNFYLHTNGITVICENATFGDSGEVNGVIYTKRTAQAIKDDDSLAATACTSGISDMSGLFKGNSVFNSDISHWDTSQVTTMYQMFDYASSFNQAIGSWNISNVRRLDYMFRHATSFNQPIGSWDTRQVTTMRVMFFAASNFNKPIGNWNISKVEKLDYTWHKAYNFNQYIGDWDTSNVQNLRFAFNYASSFNQPIGNWDTSKVETIEGIFSRAYSFNQSIGAWDTSKVNNMDWVFYEASSFNQDLTRWCVTGITSQPTNFATSSALSTENLPQWGQCPVPKFHLNSNGVTVKCDDAVIGESGRVNGVLYTKRTAQEIKDDNSLAATACTSGINDMSELFKEKSGFNTNISHWDTSKVTRMHGMFRGCSAFNQPIDSWDTSQVTSMARMFTEASSFNQELRNWQLFNVKNMNFMFYNSGKQNLDSQKWSLSSLETARHMIEGPDILKNSVIYDKLTELSACNSFPGCFASGNENCSHSDLADICLPKCGNGYKHINGFSATVLGGKDWHQSSEAYPFSEPKWIWGNSTAANDGIHLSVHTLLQNNGSSDIEYKLFVIIDNYGDVYVDGEPIRIFIGGPNNVTFTLTPGNHILSIVAANAGDGTLSSNTFGIFAAIFETGSDRPIDFSGSHWLVGTQLETQCCPQNTLCIGTDILCRKGAGWNETSCVSCEAGSFSAAVDRLGCTSCPLGQYQADLGMAECVRCSAGYFQDQEGQSQCSKCPAGTFQANNGSAECLQCSAGYFQDQEGQSQCSKCPAGTYQPENGKNACIECPENSVCSGSEFSCLSTFVLKDGSCVPDSDQANDANSSQFLSSWWFMSAASGGTVFIIVLGVILYRRSKNSSNSFLDDGNSDRMIKPFKSINVGDAGNPAALTGVVTTFAENSEFSLPVFLKMNDKQDFKIGDKIAKGGDCVINECQSLSHELAHSAASSELVFKYMGPSFILMPDKKRRAFVQEVSFMWRLRSSPLFVDVKGYCEEPMGIIMPRYEWGDLLSFIKDRSKLSQKESYSKNNILRIISDLSRAIQYLHNSSLAHCDIKPGNVLLERPKMGIIKAVLTDFGISRVLDSSELKVDGFESIDVNGVSLAFAAPESLMRLRGRVKDVTTKEVMSSDVFSLSLTFYNVITRNTPWIGH